MTHNHCTTATARSRFLRRPPLAGLRSLFRRFASDLSARTRPLRQGWCEGLRQWGTPAVPVGVGPLGFSRLEPRVLLSTVEGSVYFDLNFDGTQQVSGGESALPGFVVIVDVNGNGTFGDGPDLEAETDAGGYSIDGLSGGTYNIRVQPREGWANTSAATRSVNVPASGTVSNIDFGVELWGSVSGQLFNDLDGDGQRDGGEGFLSGQTIRIYNDDTNALVATLTTGNVDVDGNGSLDPGGYFAQLRPRNYRIELAPDAGFVQTTPEPGVPNHTVEMVSGNSNLLHFEDLDFGAVLSGTVSGNVFSDGNGDGSGSGDPGLPGVRVYSDLNNNGQYDSDLITTPVFTYAGPSVAIPDNNSSGISRSISVMNVKGVITDVNVVININHSSIRDLHITLISPSGTEIFLHDRRTSGPAGANFTGTTFDDEATLSFNEDNPSVTAPFTDSFVPEEALYGLDGEDPNGEWTLLVSDRRALDSGTFVNFSLEFTTFQEAEPSDMTDGSGNFTIEGLVPGTHRIRLADGAGIEQTTGDPGNVNVTGGGTVSNITFGAQEVSGGFDLDIDNDASNAVSVFTDGFLVLRYMLGFTGNSLVQGALAGTASRDDPQAIIDYLDGASATMLDVDGNGSISVFTDGFLILRYMLGFTGTSLTNGAIGSGATRTTATQITNFLDGFQPGATGGAALPAEGATGGGGVQQSSWAAPGDGGEGALKASIVAWSQQGLSLTPEDPERPATALDGLIAQGSLLEI